MLGLKPGRAFRWELARSCALYSKLYGAKHTRDLSQAQGLESGPPLGQGASAVALPHALPHAVSQRIPWLNAQESHQIRLPDFAKRARWLCAQRVTQEAPRGPSAASLALDLNPEQQRAVETGERTVRVKAGPGSGKTRVVVGRVLHLVTGLQQVHPRSMAVITFTNKAANELNERMAVLSRKAAGDAGAAEAVGDVRATTFHKLGAGILSVTLNEGMRPSVFGLKRNYTILNQYKTGKLIAQAIDEVESAQQASQGQAGPTTGTGGGKGKGSGRAEPGAREEQVEQEAHAPPEPGTGPLLPPLTARAALQLKSRLSRLLRVLKTQLAAVQHFDDSTAVQQCKQVVSDLSGPGVWGADTVDDEALKAFVSGSSRSGRWGSDQAAVNARWSVGRVQLYYDAYTRLLRSNNAADFEDLIALPVRLLAHDEELRRMWRSRLQHILVDEFQDTDGAQYQLLKLLRGPHASLFVVGDPDQAIYEWRGAEPDNMRALLPKDYPDTATYHLTTNYRSEPTLVAKADALLRAAWVPAGLEMRRAILRGLVRSLWQELNNVKGLSYFTARTKHVKGLLQAAEEQLAEVEAAIAAAAPPPGDMYQPMEAVRPPDQRGPSHVATAAAYDNPAAEADAIAARIKDRWLAARAWGHPLHHSHSHGVEKAAGGGGGGGDGGQVPTVAVLVRYRALLRPLEEAMARHRLPFAVVGGMPFWEHKAVNGVLSYLHVVADPLRSDTWLTDVLNTPTRALDDKSATALVEAAAAAGCTLGQLLFGDMWSCSEEAEAPLWGGGGGAGAEVGSSSGYERKEEVRALRAAVVAAAAGVGSFDGGSKRRMGAAQYALDVAPTSPLVAVKLNRGATGGIMELRGLVHALRCAALGPAGDDAVGGGGGLAGGWRGGPLRVHRLVGALLVFLELREQAVRGGEDGDVARYGQLLEAARCPEEWATADMGREGWRQEAAASGPTRPIAPIDRGLAGLRRFLDHAALVSSSEVPSCGRGKVHLSTVHGAKGLEFDVVHLAGLEDNLVLLRELHEERRVFYVAFARAKDEVHLSMAKARMCHGEKWAARSSSRLADPLGLVFEDQGTRKGKAKQQTR